MPTSHGYFISDIVEKITDMQPKSILDIGCGFGKYGMLAREYTDIRAMRYNKEDWQTKIDCIEVWPDYITSVHRHIYNTIMISNVLETTIDEYDMIIACDVIEHLDKMSGVDLITYLQSKCKCLILTLPIGDTWGEQKALKGNPHEEHKSKWYNLDFIGFDCFYADINGKEYGLFIWED